jgi:Uma2 family endonuclease
MGQAEIFGPEERVELVDGDVIDVPKLSSQCAGTLDHLAKLLWSTVGDLAQLRVRNPVSFDTYSEFQPDLTLVQARTDYYRSAHPRADHVLLAVEVADDALRNDRNAKIATYARHGIPEAWLVDTESLKLMRYRNPARAAYTLVEQPDLEIPIDVDTLPGVRVALRPLFAHLRA